MDMSRRTALTGAAALSLASAVPAWSETATDVVSTRSGPYRGLTNASSVHVFKGVRYGEDTALTRFAKPIAAQRQTTIVNAVDYGAASPQTRTVEQSEDCLFLNVWTPGLNDGGERPVMVYFHGGAYASGSGSSPLYDGTNLAVKGDVVVVTVNHRLNAFGYLYLDRLLPGAFPDSGNAGQWDLVLALQWVRDNIRAFGGNPNRVMTFGQSGGGAKIATLMATPAARNLFHNCATMSGQQVTACGPLNGTARAQAYLSKLGLPADVEALKFAPAGQLVEALQTPDPINADRRLYFGPVLDDRMLMRHPFWPDAPAQSADIPMILGNTKDETRAFLGGDEAAYALTWDDLPDWLERNMRCDIHPQTVIDTYRETFPEMSASDVMFAATTAGRSWRGQVEESDARARQASPTWVYQFNLPSPAEGGRRGAGHSIDIAHAFDNLDQPGATSGTGPTARRVADQLSTAFISLARTGDPNHAGLPQWDQHTLPARETMVFDATTQQIDDPRRVERELFAKVPFIQWGT